MAKKKTQTAEKPVYTLEEIELYRNRLKQERQKIYQRIRSASSSLTTSRQAGEEAADIGSDDLFARRACPSCPMTRRSYR